MYLAAHANPRTRALHYPGAILGVASLVAVGATGDWRWLSAALVAGYALAWLGRPFEHNRPATFETRTSRSSETYGCSPFPVPAAGS